MPKHVKTCNRCIYSWLEVVYLPRLTETVVEYTPKKCIYNCRLERYLGRNNSETNLPQ